jgi:hypothetical protein
VSFLEGLKRKSRYVIALQDYNPPGNFSVFKNQCIKFLIFFNQIIDV